MNPLSGKELQKQFGSSLLQEMLLLLLSQMPVKNHIRGIQRIKKQHIKFIWGTILLLGTLLVFLGT